QTAPADASGSKPAVSPASPKSMHRAGKRRGADDQEALRYGGFCRECRAGSTPRAPSGVSTSNWVGPRVYGGAGECEQCGSVVRVLWFVLLYIPLVPLGAYRYKRIEDGLTEGRFRARLTRMRWEQVLPQWGPGLLVGVVIVAVVAALAGGGSRR